MRLPSATAISLQPADASRERLQTAARELESQFAQMMLKSMRSASLGDSMLGDNTMYRDMYDQQLAKEMTKGRGLGLAPMIEQQLSRSMPTSIPTTTGPMDLSFSLDTVSGAGPMQLMQNLPVPMPLTGTGNGGVLLTPSRSGVSMSAAAPFTTTHSPSSQPSAFQVTAASAAVNTDANGSNKTSPGSNAEFDCSTPEAFVRSIWPQAQETARELGVSAKALVAQAALETGWGRRLVGGNKSHNLFGIKSSANWRGARVESATHEFVDGKRQSQRANFRAYSSVQQSFADYAQLMRNQRYSGAIAAGDDANRFASALQKAGYATDPSYAAKISAIANGSTLRRAIDALDAAPERAYAALSDTNTRG